MSSGLAVPARARLRRPLPTGVVRGAYPERRDEPESGLDEWLRRLTAPAARRWRVRRSAPPDLCARVGTHAAELAALSSSALREQARDVGRDLRVEGLGGDAAVRAAALVREAASRELGMAHHDVQLVGGWLMLQGYLAEMDTGEGKTLTATVPAAVAGLAGVPVHVVTVNEYLARRDAETMRPVYEALGLSVGLVCADQPPDARRAAYACDVTYCTNKDLVFDYLRDRVAIREQGGVRLRVSRVAGRSEAKLLHRGLHFAIVDEADSVLVDEARTPLILSQRSQDGREEALHAEALRLARELQPGTHFRARARDRDVELLAEGSRHLARIGEETGGLWRGRRRREALVCQALAALHLYQRDRDYIVENDKVQIVDEFTGRVMPDRSWEDGLHQMIEVKEAVALTGRQQTLARISYQRFFRRYLRLAGMTGTASEAAAELWSVYRLPVVRVPTHRPSQRRDLGERIFATSGERWDAVVERVMVLRGERREGRPVLVGTRSVAASELLSARLREAGVPHRVLNARQDQEEAEIVAGAGEPGCVTVSTNMAGRGTDIRLAPGVADRGGLHVIATERHEARRIDRQLFGRCGRQGDPGSHEVIASLEDELLLAHGHGALAFWLGDGEKGRRLKMRMAQGRAERLHGRMRRDLLASDARLESLLAFSGRGE